MRRVRTWWLPIAALGLALVPSATGAAPWEDALSRAEVGDGVRLEQFPVAPGRREAVQFERFDVYASSARVVTIEPDGSRRELPRSRLRFFRARVEGGGRLVLSFDPGTGLLAGRTAIAGQEWTWRSPRVPLGSESSFETEMQEVTSPDAPEAAAFTCSASEQPLSALFGSRGARRETALALAIEEPARHATFLALEGMHALTVAVDTDNELLHRLYANDTAEATAEIETLFAELNTIYERDVGVRLLIGETILRVSTVPDPYHQPCGPAASLCNSSAPGQAQLEELSDYWSTHCGAACTDIERGLVLQLSGKQNISNKRSGIAWIQGLCSQTFGYSINQVSWAPGHTLSTTLNVIAHELGHNFGALHTHCRWADLPEPFIDTCWSSPDYLDAEGNLVMACFQGEPALQCPDLATFQGVENRGTLMSYCNNIGCTPIGNVFHPRSLTEYVDPHVEENTGPEGCVVPLFQISSVIPSSGPTSGATEVTIHGAGFLTGGSVNSVYFDSTVPASGAIDVVDDSTIVATSPAHPGGAVNVRLTKSGGAEAVRADSFFYADASEGLDFFDVTPCRLVDTRGNGAPIQGGSFAAGEEREWLLASAGAICGVPATARAVAVNVTVAAPTGVGWLEFYPGNAFPLGTITLAFSAGQTRANNAVVGVSTFGAGEVGIQNNSTGTAHVILDVTGYFE